MDLAKKEREKFEELSKEAMLSLSVKDDIINDMKIQLDNEIQENSNLRSKLKDLETKIMLIDENLDLDDDKFKNSVNSKKSSATNRNFFKNLSNSTEKQENINYDNNVRNMIEESRILFEENNLLREKLKEFENDNINLTNKTQKLQELEILSQQKIDSQKIRLDQSEIYFNQVRDRENYIDELISRYKTVENEFESIVKSKDIEIKGLINNVNNLAENIESLTNQINFLSENSNSMTQDLIKEIRSLEGQNKDLEMKIYKNEFLYQEEIKLLHKSLPEAETVIKNQNQSKNVSASCNLPNDLKVEDLTNSLSKSILERVEIQNKKIATQNFEIINLKYENEKINSEFNHEKEVNQKLQQSLADQKYKISVHKGLKNETEESACQTNLKFEDIEQFKRKNKNLENENNNLNEKLFLFEKDVICLKEKIVLLESENFKVCNELNVLVRKMDRNKKSKDLNNLDQDLLYNISNISKLNATISQMKLRENELLETIQMNEYSNIPNKNISPEINNMEKNKNCNKNFNNTKSLQQTKFFNSGLNAPIKNKEDSNILISFNVSEESNERDQNNNNNPHNNMGKSTHHKSSNIEIELKKLTEDNFYLKEKNFNYITELQRLQDNLNFYRLQLSNKVYKNII